MTMSNNIMLARKHCRIRYLRRILNYILQMTGFQNDEIHQNRINELENQIAALENSLLNIN